MPAITSPLRALRLSGRLMVIQYACPCFSSITLLLSVIAALTCLRPFLTTFALGLKASARDDFGSSPDCLYLECSNLAGDIAMSAAARNRHPAAGRWVRHLSGYFEIDWSV